MLQKEVGNTKKQMKMSLKKKRVVRKQYGLVGKGKKNKKKEQTKKYLWKKQSRRNKERKVAERGRRR